MNGEREGVTNKNSLILDTLSRRALMKRDLYRASSAADRIDPVGIGFFRAARTATVRNNATNAKERVGGGEREGGRKTNRAENVSNVETNVARAALPSLSIFLSTIAVA